jgi:hypothetical protein
VDDERREDVARKDARNAKDEIGHLLLASFAAWPEIIFPVSALPG